jgi:DNA-nicking Smr family endonuclease
VRVIHGKGLTSPGREPVLKHKVRQWLSHWDDVLAYCEAPRQAGGGGAVLVLLKGGAPPRRVPTDRSSDRG